MPSYYLREEESPADRGVVYICEKCGKGAEFSGKDLKSDLREMLKEKGEKKSVRIAFTSCLDICPKDGIALSVVPSTKGQSAEYCVASGKLHEASKAILAKLDL